MRRYANKETTKKKWCKSLNPAFGGSMTEINNTFFRDIKAECCLVFLIDLEQPWLQHQCCLHQSPLLLLLLLGSGLTTVLVPPLALIGLSICIDYLTNLCRDARQICHLKLGVGRFKYLDHEITLNSPFLSVCPSPCFSEFTALQVWKYECSQSQEPMMMLLDNRP